MVQKKPLLTVLWILEKFNIKVFGPRKIAAQLEGSKNFTKKFVKNTKFQLQILAFLNENDAKEFILK